MNFTVSLGKLLFLTAMACSHGALADIYVDADTSDEISINNFGGDERFEVLISEDQLQPNAPTHTLATPTRIESMPFADAVQTASRENMLDPALIHAVISIESNNNPNATSPRGAKGLMQLMPATARQLGLHNPYDPAQNIRAGSHYLNTLNKIFKGDLNLVLAAYNAGPGAVLRYGSKIPPFEETRQYVPKVLQLYRELSARNQ